MRCRQRFKTLRSTSTRLSMLSLIRQPNWESLCVYPVGLSVGNTQGEVGSTLIYSIVPNILVPDMAGPQGPGIFGGSDSGADPGVAVWGFWLQTGPHWSQLSWYLHTKTTDVRSIEKNFPQAHFQQTRSAGSMAERLTTNQEVPGSTPGWIDSSFAFSFLEFCFARMLTRSFVVSCDLSRSAFCFRARICCFALPA